MKSKKMQVMMLAVVSILLFTLCGIVAISNFDKNKGSLDFSKAETRQEYLDKNTEVVNGQSITYSTYNAPIMPTTDTVGNTYVEGRIMLQYRMTPHAENTDEDFDVIADTATVPLKNAKIVLFDEDFWFFRTSIGETYTDENGNYRFEFNNGHLEFMDDIFMRVYASSETFHTISYKNIQAFTADENSGREIFLDFDMGYYIESPVVRNVRTGSTTYFDWEIGYNPGESNDNNPHNNKSDVYSAANKCYRAFYMSQAIVAAQNFLKEKIQLKIEEKIPVLFL